MLCHPLLMLHILFYTGMLVGHYVVLARVCQTRTCFILAKAVLIGTMHLDFSQIGINFFKKAMVGQLVVARISLIRLLMVVAAKALIHHLKAVECW